MPYDLSSVSKISIFEIYLKTPKAVDQLHIFLTDTLKLPVEWQPFDIFGDSVVYDAAYYLGNTTLEVLALYQGDAIMTEEARYNRILFKTESIGNTSTSLTNAGIQPTDPFDFNIVSDQTKAMIGKQINLDSLSNWSNINIAFWQYLDAGYRFKERPTTGETFEELKSQLQVALAPNPMGIMELKEVHITVDEKALRNWKKLLGPAEQNQWILSEGPVISYSNSSRSARVDWITIRVKGLETAKKFLAEMNLLSSETDNRISIDKSKVCGLIIYFEE